jgi:hypothetical protein
MAQAFETLRLLIGPFMSSRADGRTSRGLLAQALPSAPGRWQWGRAVDGGDVVRRFAVETGNAEAVVFQFRHGARQVGDLDERHVFIGARGRRRAPLTLPAVSGGGHQRRDVEGRTGAQDGAHIVRIGHLVSKTTMPDFSIWSRRGWVRPLAS